MTMICPMLLVMDKSCCWGGDLSAVRRWKVAVVGGRLPAWICPVADHSPNSPFLPFFGEVCTLGGTLPYESHCADDASIRRFHATTTPADTGYHMRSQPSAQRWSKADAPWPVLPEDSHVRRPACMWAGLSARNSGSTCG